MRSFSICFCYSKYLAFLCTLHLTRQEKLTGDKHSSFLGRLVNYKENELFLLRSLASCQCYKTFFSVINATISMFPYNFEGGYADNDVTMSKIFYNFCYDKKALYHWPQVSRRKLWGKIYICLLSKLFHIRYLKKARSFYCEEKTL